MTKLNGVPNFSLMEMSDQDIYEAIKEIRCLGYAGNRYFFVSGSMEDEHEA